MKCECAKPTVDINGTCQNCASNEVYDDVLKICVCVSGAFKNSKSVCVKCAAKMALFEDKCECIFNYYESSGVCKRCIRETDGPKCKRNLAWFFMWVLFIDYSIGSNLLIIHCRRKH